MSAIFTLQQLRDNLTMISVSPAFAPEMNVYGVVTDSRKIVPGCLFVALRGEYFDAHDFLAEAAQKGAAAVIVERLMPDCQLPALVVPDSRVALGEIARYWRRQFALPMIGVTGSNGKTTVKEMIAAILSSAFGADDCLATQGNLNNDIGVPQTLLRLHSGHRAAVIEMGMNHPGEIAQLSAIAEVTVGLVNNAQREHQEFMQSVDAVAAENGSVILGLSSDGVAVFPADEVYSDLWRSYAGARKIITFGLGQGDVSATWQASEFGNCMQVSIAGAVLTIELAAAGLHNVRNALAAIACCHAIGCNAAAIIDGLEKFAPVSGRLQKKRAANLATVIDDTYNANPDSVRAAIDVLAQSAGKKILVLGDMGEVGSDGPAYHSEIGRYAHERGVQMLLTLGTLAQHSSAVFGSGAQHFGQIEQLLPALDACADSAATILVKGSRFMKMERVVTHLINAQLPGSER